MCAADSFRKSLALDTLSDEMNQMQNYSADAEYINMLYKKYWQWEIPDFV